MESIQPTSYRAVLIGIDAYAGKPLDGCVNDIDQIERILLDRLGVPPERITRLAAPHDGAATSTRLPSSLPTREGIWNALSSLVDEVDKKNTVFLYYSGHGGQTEVRPVAREALVPMDYDHTAERLLWDFQLNPLLARIAAKAGDLTIVLDCCHSASATRIDAKSRCLPLENLPGVESLVPSGAQTRDTAGLQPSSDSQLVVAACRAGELAYEVPPKDSKLSHGSLTRALVGILDTTDHPLAELRWADVWNVLTDRVTDFESRQHPHLIGRSERRIFGGPWAKRDLGSAIRPDGYRFRIEAGTLMGFSKDAEVAVYGPEPDLFPETGSEEDQESRIGLLRVETAEKSFCVASSIGGSLTLPTAARGRLVKPGEADQLRVVLEPFDRQLADLLSTRGMLVSDQMGQGEVSVRCDGAGRIQLCDAVYGEDRDPKQPPLASLPAGQWNLLVKSLEHYGRYNRVLRLPERCKDIPKALQIELLACKGLHGPITQAIQTPDLPPLEGDKSWRYKIREGEGFAIRISNQLEGREAPLLYVMILNCAGSGRVEYLGDGEVAAGAQAVFWNANVLGSPFCPSISVDGRQEIIDRIVVVATTLPDRDLRYLEVRESFAETLDPTRTDRTHGKDMVGATRAVENPPTEEWTAEMIAVRIYKEVTETTTGGRGHTATA